MASIVPDPKMPSSRGAAPVTHVRGSLVVMSLRSLRQRGLEERYFQALAPSWHEAIRTTTASVWVPIDVVTAHYLACEALGLPEETIQVIGAEAGASLNQRVVAVMVRLATADPRPWIALTKFPRLNEQLWRGGEMLVERLGEDRARIEWRGQPLAAIRYFGLAYMSYVRAVLSPYSPEASVEWLASESNDVTLVCRVAWS